MRSYANVDPVHSLNGESGVFKTSCVAPHDVREQRA